MTADPTWVELDVADTVAARATHVVRLELRLQISGELDPQRLGVKFNGITLRDPEIKAGWWTYRLTARQFAEGRNLVTVDGNKAGEDGRPMTLEKVEIHVRYGTRENGK